MPSFFHLSFFFRQKVTKMSHRRWSPEEMAKSTNSIVLDMLTISETTGTPSSSSKKRMESQDHPFYDVIYEVELLSINADSRP